MKYFESNIGERYVIEEEALIIYLYFFIYFPITCGKLSVKELTALKINYIISGVYFHKVIYFLIKFKS